MEAERPTITQLSPNIHFYKITAGKIHLSREGRKPKGKRDRDSHENIIRISHISLELQQSLVGFVPPRAPQNIQSAWFI